MSGGEFDYIQFRFSNVAHEIRKWIEKYGGCYSEATVQKLEETAAQLELAGKMLHRVDWFISGDDGEESFHERWKTELQSEENNVKN